MRKHTAHRARQRYGLYLPYLKQLQIVRLILAESDTVVRLQSRNKREILAIKWEDIWLPAVYDKQRTALVTILPPAAFKRYNFDPEAK